MASPEIEELGKLLIQHVRDLSIRTCDRKLQAQANGAVAKRWKELKTQGNLDAIAKVLIPDVVDSVLQHLLYAIDQGFLKLSFTASNGKMIDLPKDGLGEVSGWYMGGGDNWRERYSQERFVDDFTHVKSLLLDHLREREPGNEDKGTNPR